jgi:hypothetical protein
MHTQIRTLIARKLRNLIRMKIRHEFYLTAGIAVGNGFTDPITILDYSHFVYQLGLVDTNTYNDMKSVEEAGKTAIRGGNLVEAFLVYTTFGYTQLSGIHNFLVYTTSHNLSCGFRSSVYHCQ